MIASRRTQRNAGGVLLLLFVGSAILFLASPGVRVPGSRVLGVVLRDVFPDRGEDVLLPVSTTEGIFPGLPAFLDSRGGGERPTAHVVGVEGSTVRLRFEPGEDTEGPWRLRVFAPSRTLAEALDLAVPPEAREAVQRDLAERWARMWGDALLPDLRARLPAFLRRIDPTRAEASQRLLAPTGEEVLRRLNPLFTALADEITEALKRKFDLLDRMGLLWKLLRGDAQGLKAQILPVAEQTARSWWAVHQNDVLRAAGEGLRARGPQIEEWLREEVLVAAEEELLRPLLAAHADTLESEGRAFLETAAKEVALAPAGGFRARFAALLRHQLLGNRSALLLLERAP